MTTARYLAILSTLTLLAAPQAGVAGEPGKGKVTYEARCAFCHGMNGKGDGIAGSSLQPPPSNFTSPDYWAHTTNDTLRNAIENGKPGTAMVGFKTALQPGEVDDLIAYLELFRPH